jgi:RHH-type transcriptional regulator, proline utilization regulon repressor / proline dehydrogenase / delta 1-pyrroline-5-carboxylate dehydrogenase
MTPFSNEPVLELRRSIERERLHSALEDFDRQGTIEVPAVVAGERRFTPDFASIDPGSPARAVASATAATHGDVDAAVAAASSASLAWAETRAAERACILSAAAGELRRRRYELAARAVRECAKPWAEADADVCEAIDFLEYYGRQAIELDKGPELLQMPGERNTLRYRARGVAAVIAPWNFPFAIAAGMTAAALATGNAVCLKPAEQSPACALAIFEAFDAAGLPSGALSLLPGGGEVGAELVGNPGVHTIAFTGSREVGLEIIRRAAVLAPDQPHLKRTVIEMGGKNCILVDADADLDDVVPAVLASAFGFAGQKCSAASRLLVHERVADRLRERLVGALQTVQVGQAEDFNSDVPPVIELESKERIEMIVAAAAGEGAALARVERLPGGEGFFCAPTLIFGPAPDSRVVVDEVFGPVLTFEPVAGVEEASELVAGQSYALTGGLFSRNPRTIAALARSTPVGNLYVNRGTTGAMVGRQPFGGNRLSGTGAKAGGPDYLLNFVDPVTITENTVRHGLAP